MLTRLVALFALVAALAVAAPTPAPPSTAAPTPALPACGPCLTRRVNSTSCEPCSEQLRCGGLVRGWVARGCAHFAGDARSSCLDLECIETPGERTCEALGAPTETLECADVRCRRTARCTSVRCVRCCASFTQAHTETHTSAFVVLPQEFVESLGGEPLTRRLICRAEGFPCDDGRACDRFG